MQIRFIYSSDELRDSDQVQAVLASLPELFRKHQVETVPDRAEVNDDHVVTVRFEINLGDSDDIEESVRIATRSVQVFVDLSNEIDVTWNVGHELDPHLGTITSGRTSKTLVDEIRMALNVAQSLAGMIVDDEFVEPESFFDGQSLVKDNALTDDESWNGLLEPEDAFIRFPEFE